MLCRESPFNLTGNGVWPTENQVPAALPNQGTADTVKYLSSQLDVEGFSHGRISGPGAAAVHAANPTKPVISSECCSCQTQRGEDRTLAPSPSPAVS